MRGNGRLLRKREVPSWNSALLHAHRLPRLRPGYGRDAVRRMHDVTNVCDDTCAWEELRNGRRELWHWEQHIIGGVAYAVCVYVETLDGPPPKRWHGRKGTR